MVLGLTGKYCSGKNLAAEFFVSRGWYALDIDKFGHSALDTMHSSIVAAFGQGILSEDNSIDRKKLGTVVFGCKKKLAVLESIIHPEMVSQCKLEIQNNSHRNILINAAVLHHMGLNNLCDSVLWIKSGFLSRYKRAITRDKLSFFQIIKRIYLQRKLDAKYWVEDVDIHIIQNRKTRYSLEAELNVLIDKFEERV